MATDRAPATDQVLPDRNLALELVRVTEAAALAAGRWVGRGDKNLADNAARYSPEGSLVVVRASHDEGRPVLQVDDAGPGIPVAERERVFDRFYRAEGGVASGSGLGLAIARELASVMDGRVLLESVPGRTVVRVILGAAPTSVPADEAERVFT